LRERVRRILKPHLEGGACRIALWGTGNAAEVAYICLLDYGLEEIAVFDGDRMKTFMGRQIRDKREFVPKNFDRVIIAEVDPMEAAGEATAELARLGVPPGMIVSLIDLAGCAVGSLPEPMMVA
jgi:hypothetical protein